MGNYGHIPVRMGYADIRYAVFQERLAVVMVVEVHFLLEYGVEQGPHCKFLLAQCLAADKGYLLHLIGGDGTQFHEFVFGLGDFPYRDFSLVFWPLIFPFVLATAMYFSIGQMEEADFETVRAAVVVKQNAEEDVFSDYLSELEKDDSGLISIQEMSESKAAGALADGEIEGIYYSGDTPVLTVDGSGFPQSILQMILESYLEGKQTLEDIARLHPEGMEAAVRQCLPPGPSLPYLSAEWEGAETGSRKNFLSP